MAIVVDARGLSCPQPVIMARRAMEAWQFPVTVLVDSGAARVNVTRMGERAGCHVQLEEGSDSCKLTLSKPRNASWDRSRTMIYMDNAATSWPKPPGVAQAMVHYLSEVGANPGRSGHRLSIAAARIVYSAREAVAELLGAPDPLGVVWTANVTEALNVALAGVLQPGDHVITSSMEHNSMMRPLRVLERQGVELTVLSCSARGALDPRLVEPAIRPNTMLVALNHASNVVGTLLPVAEVGHIAGRHGLLLLVDAAQTAGAYPIDMQADGIDLLAFTGHKSLLGPMGTGGLIIGERVDLARWHLLKRGGTGSRSEREEQPDFLPDMAESGTPNAVGIAGLLAAMRYVAQRGQEAIRAHEVALTGRLIEGLCAIQGVTVYGGLSAVQQTATVSFDIAGMDPSEVGLRLDEAFEIMCRVGLHCAPAAHKTIGTFPSGTVRFGLGPFSTMQNVDGALAAVECLAQDAR